MQDEFSNSEFSITDSNNQQFLSKIKGNWGGHKLLKIFGKLNCPSALYWIDKGHYTKHRVFFHNVKNAMQAGYRPCAKCLPEAYSAWKSKKPQSKIIFLCEKSKP